MPPWLLLLRQRIQELHERGLVGKRVALLAWRRYPIAVATFWCSAATRRRTDSVAGGQRWLRACRCGGSRLPSMPSQRLAGVDHTPQLWTVLMW